MKEYKAPENLWSALDTILVSPVMEINPKTSPNLTAYIAIPDNEYDILTKGFSNICVDRDIESIDKEIIKTIIIAYNNQYESNELSVNIIAIRATNTGVMINFTCDAVDESKQEIDIHEKLKFYFVLVNDIEYLENKKEQIRKELQGTLKKLGVDKLKTDLGTISYVTTYRESLDKGFIDSILTADQKLLAYKKTESKYIKITKNKEVD